MDRDYKKGKGVNEALYKMAVIQGLDKSFQKDHPIKKIWCGKKEHGTIKRIQTKNGEYQSKNTFRTDGEKLRYCVANWGWRNLIGSPGEGFNPW